MTFRQAVESTPHLQGAWQEGLQALRAQDRPHIEPENPRNFRGSADIDSAWRRIEPHAHRWDFGIAYQHSNLKAEFIYWIEVHTASDSQVSKVIEKARWLLQWLKTHARALNEFEREIIWISSGKTSFTLNAPRKKMMAEMGLRHKGSRLRIANLRPAL